MGGSIRFVNSNRPVIASVAKQSRFLTPSLYYEIATSLSLLAMTVYVAMAVAMAGYAAMTVAMTGYVAMTVAMAGYAAMTRFVIYIE